MSKATNPEEFEPGQPLDANENQAARNPNAGRGDAPGRNEGRGRGRGRGAGGADDRIRIDITTPDGATRTLQGRRGEVAAQFDEFLGRRARVHETGSQQPGFLRRVMNGLGKGKLNPMRLLSAMRPWQRLKGLAWTNRKLKGKGLSVALMGLTLWCGKDVALGSMGPGGFPAYVDAHQEAFYQRMMNLSDKLEAQGDHVVKFSDPEVAARLSGDVTPEDRIEATKAGGRARLLYWGSDLTEWLGRTLGEKPPETKPLDYENLVDEVFGPGAQSPGRDVFKGDGPPEIAPRERHAPGAGARPGNGGYGGSSQSLPEIPPEPEHGGGPRRHYPRPPGDSGRAAHGESAIEERRRHGKSQSERGVIERNHPRRRAADQTGRLPPPPRRSGPGLG